MVADGWMEIVSGAAALRGTGGDGGADGCTPLPPLWAARPLGYALVQYHKTAGLLRRVMDRCPARCREEAEVARAGAADMANQLKSPRKRTGEVHGYN